jgi:hypothetical protein
MWVIVVVAVVGFASASCQSGVTMWSSCSNAPGVDPFGTDGQYVLQCQSGKWKPILTVGQYLAIEQHKPVSIEPLPTQPTVPGAGCYGSTHFAHPDIEYTGRLDAENARIYDSVDGSCSGNLIQIQTIVSAFNSADADVACIAEGARVVSYLGISIFGLGYAGLTDMWGCR